MTNNAEVLERQLCEQKLEEQLRELEKEEEEEEENEKTYKSTGVINNKSSNNNNRSAGIGKDSKKAANSKNSTFTLPPTDKSEIPADAVEITAEQAIELQERYFKSKRSDTISTLVGGAGGTGDESAAAGVRKRK